MKLKLLQAKISKMQSMNWVKKNWQKLKKSNLVAWIKEHWIVLIITFLVMSIFLLPFWFDYAMQYFEINTKKDNTPFQWKVITGLGYAIGMLLLIMQISISNRRATAAEETARATLESNVEQRYHNAVNHLQAKEPFIRIGAIYNLYHISQSTNTYDQTIFDIFCEFLRQDKNNINIKEKQIIIDKLLKNPPETRVLKDIKNVDLTGVDLTGVDLTGVDLTGVDLTGVDLTGVDLTGVDFTGIDFTGIEIPYAWDQWANIKSLKNSKLDNIVFGSGVDLSNKNLQGASLINVNMSYINLTGSNLTNADLTGSNLTNATGLTFEQLNKVKCLFDVKGLDANIEKKLKQEKLKLFNKLDT